MRDINLWSWTLNLVIASYISKNPDIQVRKMAKRYKSITKDKTARLTFNAIIRSKSPSKTVQVAYHDLTEQRNKAW